jgi:hypothetical protein
MKQTIKLNNKVSVLTNAPLSKMQTLVLSKMRYNSEKLDYLQAIGGARSTFKESLRDNVRRTRRGFQSHYSSDMLAAKKPNTMLLKFLQQFDATTDKRPDATSKGDWIGIEIECMIPFFSILKKHSSDLCGDYINEDGEECEDVYLCDNCNGKNTRDSIMRDKLADIVKMAKIRGVTIKPDGSIKNERGTFPVEVCILFKRGDMSTLQKICDLLNSLKARVNKSCGLHVHLDARDADTRQATLRGRRLFHAIDIFAAMVPKSRRTNQYCELRMNGQKDGSRYAAVNIQAYQKYQTIEMRLHSATTDFMKISMWISILFKTSRSVKMSVRKITPIVDFAKRIELTDAELSYLFSRVEKFKDDNKEESSGIAA